MGTVTRTASLADIERIAEIEEAVTAVYLQRPEAEADLAVGI